MKAHYMNLTFVGFIVVYAGLSLYVVFLESHGNDVKLFNCQYKLFPQKKAKTNTILGIVSGPFRKCYSHSVKPHK